MKQSRAPYQWLVWGGAVIGGLWLGSCALPPQSTIAPSTVPPAVVKTDVQDIAAFLRARWAEDQGDWAEAARQYQTLATRQTPSVRALERLFAFHLVAGHIPEASAVARQLLESTSEDLNLPRLVVVVQAVAAQDWAAAAAALQQFPAELKTELLPYGLLDTYIRLQLGQLTTAEAAETLKTWPTDLIFEAEKLYHVGRLWAAQGDWDNAIQAWQQALALNPTHLSTVLGLLQLAQQRGDIAAVARVAAAYVQLKPKSGLMVLATTPPAPGLSFTPAFDLAEVCFALAQLMLAQQAHLHGQQLLQLAWALAPSPHYAFYLGVLAEEQEDYKTAQFWYQRLPLDHPFAVAATLRHSVVTALAGEVATARRQLATLAPVETQSVAVLETSAELAFQAHDYSAAMVAYKKLLEAFPQASAEERASWWFGRGAAAERQRDYVTAQRDLAAALALAPDNPTTLNYLGYMLVDQRLDVPRGQKYLAQAVALAPGNAAILDSMGWAYYRVGDWPKALDYLEKAATLEPDDPVITDHLADVYAKLGRLTEAQTLWRRALRQNPTEPGLKEAIEQKLKLSTATPSPHRP